MNTQEIFRDLDKHAAEFNFPVLDNAYVDFAATRLTAFRSTTDSIMLFEVLGFSNLEISFVNDLYGYGSCIKREGFLSSHSPILSLPEEPIFDPDTNECIADWSHWSISVKGKRLSFAPTVQDYNEAGIAIDREPGPGSLSEVALLRFLVHRLGEERLFMSDSDLLDDVPLCKKVSKFLQTTQWQHPDISDGEKPSENRSIRSLVRALTEDDPSIFAPGRPNTHWSCWIRGKPGDGTGRYPVF